MAINNIETRALIDSGSMVTTISQHFVDSLKPAPELLELENLNLELRGANGGVLPYLGYVEVLVSSAELATEVAIPALVVPDTEYNMTVPIIVGTNVIREIYLRTRDTTDIPLAWQNAFVGIESKVIGQVRSTNHHDIILRPMELVTLSGYTRINGTETEAITEPAERASSKIGVCPRVVNFENVGKGHRVPVRIFNLSAKSIHIKSGTLLCELHSVRVLRSLDSESIPTTANVSQCNATTCTKGDTFSSQCTKEMPNLALDTSRLSEEEVEKINIFLEEWEDVFSKGIHDLGPCNLVKHKIQLTTEAPFKEPHRRISPALFEEVREHLREMLETGTIENSKSPFSSNICIARKKDGSIRFCVDYRKLNNRTVKDAYAIPRVEDTLHLLAGAKYFTKLDLRSGYWQVEIEDDDKEKTAFQVGTLGFYQFTRMPFGLCNAPATFQRLMERAMGDLNMRDCLLYLDDIIIFSRSVDEHLERLKAVFTRLRQHNLKLKASKCEFFRSRVTYLGHVVSEEGIESDPEKLKDVKSWPVPKDVKQLRSFLGFAGYFRKFIKGYASIARPLNDLLVGHSGAKASKRGKRTKSVPYIWTGQHQEAFDRLKDELTHPPVLAYADYTKPFKLHTDASTIGLGAVLYQECDGVDRVIAYASRSLKPAEKNYPAHKLEFLALKWAVCDKFHDYLYGADFEVVTDNNPLTYVLTTAKLDAARQRWISELSNYNFSIRYRRGNQNVDADSLSRLENSGFCLHNDMVKAISQSSSVLAQEQVPCDTVQEENAGTDSGELVPDSLLQGTALQSQDWRRAQDQDAQLRVVRDCVERGLRLDFGSWEAKNADIRFKREWNKLKVEDGILYRKADVGGETCKQLVLPSDFREIIFQAYHDDLGHQGRDRTSYLIKSRFYWPGMDSYIKQKVKECGRCIRRKVAPSRAANLVNIESSAPMELVSIDFLSLETAKGGFENVLVITDHFSRYAQAIPTKNQSATTTAKALYDNFFVHYGFPSKLHSDKGATFESKLIRKLCQYTGIKKTRTTPYHPMGNGMVERFNRTLLDMLGTLSTRQKRDWKAYVPSLVHAYNATQHESTGFSPFYLMFGRHPRLAVDAFLGLSSGESIGGAQADYPDKLRARLTASYDIATKNARKSAGRSKEYYDRKVKHASLEIGDRVLVRNVALQGRQKLVNKWERATYIVTRQPIPDVPVYEVKQEGGKERTRLLHRNLLLPFMGMPCDDSNTSDDEESPKGRGAETVTARVDPHTYDSSASSSDGVEEEGEVRPRPYVIPMRRRPEGSEPPRRSARIRNRR